MLNDDQELLAKSTSYITPMRYVSGRIVEYDIASANITMLHMYGKIDSYTYNYLKSLPKYNREIEVGLLIKSDISYYNIIRDGIIDAKRVLFNSNNIDPASVVRIANDAVYINSSVDLKYCQFNDVVFKKKSVSSAMLKLDKLIIFFWYNDDGLNIDVKGMNEMVQSLHSEYLLSIIAEAIYIMERVSMDDALKFVGDFYKDYINLKLPKEYYRELNPQSLYHFKNSNFYLSSIESVYDLDINYNLYIIRELWSIILERYNIEIKKR